MGVVAVDSSGSFEEPPIRVVAVRTVEKQKHIALYLNATDIARYRKMIHEKTHQKMLRKKSHKKKMKQENYREKVSAAFIFRSVQELIKHTDMVQIDKDFEGWRQEMVRSYLRRLFGKAYYGTPLSSPSIEFITDHCEEGKKYVKDAHAKTQDAKRGNLEDMRPCPDLEKLLDYLE